MWPQQFFTNVWRVGGEAIQWGGTLCVCDTNMQLTDFPTPWFLSLWGRGFFPKIQARDKCILKFKLHREGYFREDKSHDFHHTAPTEFCFFFKDPGDFFLLLLLHCCVGFFVFFFASSSISLETRRKWVRGHTVRHGETDSDKRTRKEEGTSPEWTGDGCKEKSNHIFISRFVDHWRVCVRVCEPALPLFRLRGSSPNWSRRRRFLEVF